MLKWGVETSERPSGPGFYSRGQMAWKNRGIAVSQIGKLPCTLYTGELFDNNTAVVIPKKPGVYLPRFGRIVHRLITASWCGTLIPNYGSPMLRWLKSRLILSTGRKWRTNCIRTGCRNRIPTIPLNGSSTARCPGLVHRYRSRWRACSAIAGRSRWSMDSTTWSMPTESSACPLSVANNRRTPGCARCWSPPYR